MQDEEIPPDAGDLSGEDTARAILGFRLGLYDEELSASIAIMIEKEYGKSL